MDIAVPLTLEATRLVLQMLPEKYSGTPEILYNFFYEERLCTYIYIPSNGNYFFAQESDLADLRYIPVTVEKAREILFIRSLEN